MDIRHRLYPYPVLSDMTNDYINSSFGMNLEVNQGMKEICFSISLCLENEEIKQLIADDFAEYVIHIECSYTAYRTVIKTNEKYSLQGTTQGRYLTGGVPPVRFSM